jgi:hypothetical protein
MSLDAPPFGATRQQPFEAVEVTVITTGMAVSDSCGDLSKSPSSR